MEDEMGTMNDQAYEAWEQRRMGVLLAQHRAMEEATTISEMADAFHPSMWGRQAHTSPALDAVEAALLWGAGRITREDFLAAVEDLDS
jgi:hypothetical protein